MLVVPKAFYPSFPNFFPSMITLKKFSYSLALPWAWDTSHGTCSLAELKRFQESRQFHMAILFFSRLLGKCPAGQSEAFLHLFSQIPLSLTAPEKGLKTPRVTHEATGTCALAPALLCLSFSGYAEVILSICCSMPGLCSPLSATRLRPDNSCLLHTFPSCFVVGCISRLVSA